MVPVQTPKASGTITALPSLTHPFVHSFTNGAELASVAEMALVLTGRPNKQTKTQKKKPQLFSWDPLGRRLFLQRPDGKEGPSHAAIWARASRSGDNEGRVSGGASLA